MSKLYTILLFFVTLAPAIIQAQEFPARATTLVTDYTNTLTEEQKNALENKLIAFNDSTSTQIAIVVLSTLDGYPIDDYARRLAEEWGIGQKNKNNGALILVALKDRKVTIQVGYGLEPVIPDALAKRIIEKDIKPYFKENAYYEGLDKATSTMISLAKGEFKADQYMQKKEKPFPSFIVLIILGIIFIVFFSKYRAVKSYSTLNHISFWAAWALLNAASNRHRGRWGDFSSGSGGFGGGGSGGGGFSGFGGGSFGGGGASGNW